MSNDPQSRAAEAAYLLIEAGRPADALRTLTQHANPADPDVWHARALALLHLDRFEEAEAAAGRGLTIAPEHLGLFDIRAAAQACRGDLTGAERSILAALRIDAERPNLLARYAHIVALAGQLEKSERLVERALALDAENEFALTIHALIATARSDDGAAAARARALLRHAPESALAHSLLGRTRARAGSLDEAADHFVRAVRIDPTDEDAVEAARELIVERHWLLWPLRPLHRYGAGPVWIAAVVVMLTLRAIDQAAALAVFSLGWLVYCLYSWTAAPALRWWYRGRSRV